MSKVFELKVFKNGGSNAVRIPASIDIEDGKLFLVLGDNGTMTLEKTSPKPMAKFFALLEQLRDQRQDDDGKVDRSVDGLGLPSGIEMTPDRSWMVELEEAFDNPGGNQ